MRRPPVDDVGADLGAMGLGGWRAAHEAAHLGISVHRQYGVEIVEGTLPQPQARSGEHPHARYGRTPLISLGRSPTRPMAWRTKKRRKGGTRWTAARPISRASRIGLMSLEN